MTTMRSESDVAYITQTVGEVSITCDSNAFTDLMRSCTEMFFILLVWAYNIIMLAVPAGDIKWGLLSLYDFLMSGLSWVGYLLAGTEFLLMEVYYDGASYLCLGLVYVQIGLNYVTTFSDSGSLSLY